MKILLLVLLLASCTYTQPPKPDALNQLHTSLELCKQQDTPQLRARCVRTAYDVYSKAKDDANP